MLPPANVGGAKLPRLLTPAGGMFLALGTSALLWSAVVAGVHLLGGF